MKKENKQSKWVKSLVKRKGKNVAALTNKTAETIRTLVINNDNYAVA